MPAGLLFCSLQATSQQWQPMHFVMSKWKRYCSPEGWRALVSGAKYVRSSLTKSLSGNDTPASSFREKQDIRGPNGYDVLVVGGHPIVSRPVNKAKASRF